MNKFYSLTWSMESYYLYWGRWYDAQYWVINEENKENEWGKHQMWQNKTKQTKNYDKI